MRSWLKNQFSINWDNLNTERFDWAEGKIDQFFNLEHISQLNLAENSLIDGILLNFVHKFTEYESIVAVNEQIIVININRQQLKIFTLLIFFEMLINNSCKTNLFLIWISMFSPAWWNWRSFLLSSFRCLFCD